MIKVYRKKLIYPPEAKAKGSTKYVDLIDLPFLVGWYADTMVRS